jgi:3,4-dihydroxy 2-butanone 4-phosphate synthase / GTP cyclohydrolase II
MPHNTDPLLSSIDDALEALKLGKMVIVIDAKERENEGDFICAAEHITPELVSQMLRFGAGVMCVSLPEERARRLNLVPIVDNSLNTAPNRTQFLTPIDHRESGSGVSTENRARTIKELANPFAKAEDFVRPGHINPLLAKEGGVLRRAGHTEATVDLMRLANLEPVGVLIEILSETGGGMAELPELHQLATKLQIPLISIDQIIVHRRLRERLVSREAVVPFSTKRFGDFKVIAYNVAHEDQQPLAIVWGDPSTSEAPLVRVHSSCFTGDVLDSLRCDCGDQLHMAMEMIHREGSGAVVYLPQEGRGIGLVAKLKAYELQDQGLDTVEANHRLGYKADSRDYMVGLQILKDLGLSAVRLLTNNPKKISAFPAFDITLVGQVPIIAPPDSHRTAYMSTKRDKMGHLLPPD